VAFVAPGVAVAIAVVYIEGTGLFVRQMIGTGEVGEVGNILILSLATKGIVSSHMGIDCSKTQSELWMNVG
jgi:hypothetical protein